MWLSVSELQLERGGRRILDGISFSVAEGEALAITGPNGVGKSTLLRALAGLLQPTSGTISYDGGDGETPSGERIHLIGHLDGVKTGLGTLENLAFWRDFLGGGGSSPREALELTGLGHAADLPASVLSAGQRRRLALGRLLVAERPVWLLDEPATALDDDGLARLSELVTSHRAKGGLVIAATHAALDWKNTRTLHLGGQ